MNIAAKYKILNKSGRNLRKIGYQLKHVNRIASTFICSLGDEKLRVSFESVSRSTWGQSLILRRGSPLRGTVKCLQHFKRKGSRYLTHSNTSTTLQ